ncbi:MAG: hypothetical protein R8P61_06080 [Bacteroidia bacterium]|nr:hypothetical protein [Bacteroidia bacterium]
MKKTVFSLFCILLLCLGVNAQQSFPERCEGLWEGTMYISSKGQLRDSVGIIFTVEKMQEENAWVWRTKYISEKFPMTKDYILRLQDDKNQVYLTDEGDGIVLYDYLFGDKLYSVFETGGILLTASYELRGEELIFEVTSGKVQEEKVKDISNYSVNNVQRVVLRRKETK